MSQEYFSSNKIQYPVDNDINILLRRNIQAHSMQRDRECGFIPFQSGDDLSSTSSEQILVMYL